MRLKVKFDEGENFNARFVQTEETFNPSFGEVVTINNGGGLLIPGGVQGDIIIKRSSADYDAEWVAPAQSVEEDNTKPLTAAAVYTEIGNINALLATI